MMNELVGAEISDEQWKAFAEWASQRADPEEPPDDAHEYLNRDELVLVRDPLESFGNYREASKPESSRLRTGELIRFWESVQVRKGERREPLYVIDFGDFRGVHRTAF